MDHQQQFERSSFLNPYFLTKVNNKVQNEMKQVRKQKSKFDKYLNKFQQKIDYANFKQDITLAYLYTDIFNRIKEVKKDIQEYICKFDSLQKKLLKQFSTQQIQYDIQDYKQYIQITNQQIRNIQNLIEQINNKNNLINRQAHQLKLQLKNIMKINWKLQIKNYTRYQFESSQQKKSSIFKKSIYQKTFISLQRQKKVCQSLQKREIGKTLSRIKPYQKLSTRKKLYKQISKSNKKRQSYRKSSKQSIKLTSFYPLIIECLKIGIKSIYNMKSAFDIQKGITLQLCQKLGKQKQSLYKFKGEEAKNFQTKYSGDKGIGQIAYNVLKDKIKYSQQFTIDQQCFMQLNPRQIMGVLAINGIEKLYDFIKKLSFRKTN